MTDTQQRALCLIRHALKGKADDQADRPVYELLGKHALTALFLPALPNIRMPDDLRAEWKRAAVRQLSVNQRLLIAEETLPLTVPYVVLKGTQAARYYPEPALRAQGDIDVMTGREDYEEACGQLLAAGFEENTVIPAGGVIRHRGFIKDGIEVEVHAYFAMLKGPEQARYMDDLIIDHIDPSHVLPDPVNGLVILEHLSQHLEEGIGLRQVIDWMMFAERCLNDQTWPDFRRMTDRTGLTGLAKAVSAVCVHYLGMTPGEYSADVDEDLCLRLIDYVMNSGNFGSLQTLESLKSKKLISAARSPRKLFSILQHYGLMNWPAARKYTLLRPFAWLYQLGRYLKKGAQRADAIGMLRREADASFQRNRLMDELGVGQFARGSAVYSDGAYRSG